MAKIKPILFNTEMALATLENRKTVTRRVVKQLADVGFPPNTQFWVSPRSGLIYWGGIDKQLLIDGEPVIAPHHPGDILYVRETWCDIWNGNGTWLDYGYKDDGEPNGDYWGVFRNGVPIKSFKWRPSIHMPREAARIFLRVTDVKVQRVQDITEEEARREGVKKMYPYTDQETGETVYAYSEYGTYIAGFACVWNDCYAKPRPVKVKGVIHHYESYPWEDIQETRTYRGKPWYVLGNPRVFVNEFERCEKPEEREMIRNA